LTNQALADGEAVVQVFAFAVAVTGQQVVAAIALQHIKGPVARAHHRGDLRYCRLRQGAEVFGLLQDRADFRDMRLDPVLRVGLAINIL